MTKKIDDKDLGKVTGGAGPIEPSGGTTDPRITGSSTRPSGGSGSGGGPSQSGVVDNAAGNAPSSGPVDMTPNS